MAVANVVAKFEADISDVQAKMAALKKSFTDAGDSTQALTQRLAVLGNTVSDVGKKMTLGITAPLAAIGVAAIATQKDFEVSMNTLGVVSGAAATEVQALSDYAMKMGADTVYSAGEAANAMVDLAKSGFTPAQITGGGLAATMALAATEGMALTDAATTVANAMNTFGLEADQASSIADALAGGANASTASVESLTSALRQVGPGAVNAGLSLQETVATLAAFDAAGIKGSDAGTSLKTMLMRLVPTTKEAADEMNRLGINFTNADGSFKSITDIASILQARLGGLTEAQRVQTLTTLFGADATRAATVLLNEGAAGIQKYIDGTNQLGAAQQLADARMNGTAGTLEQLKGSLETAALVIGENLAPTFQLVAGLVKNATDAFLALPKPLQQLATGVGAVVAALGPLLWIGGKIMTMFAPLGGAAVALGGKMVAAFRLMGAAAKTAEIQIKTAMIGAQTQMGALVAGARAAAVGVGTAFRSMAVAARGLIASLGPIGIVMVGVGIIFESFAGRAAAVDGYISQLKETVDLTTNSLTAMGEALVAQQLFDALSAEDRAALEAYGISMAELVDAVIQGGPAFDAMSARLSAFRNQEFNPFGRFSGSDIIAQINMVRDGVVGSVEAAQAAAGAKEIAGEREAVAAQESARRQASAYRALAQDKRAADESMTDSQRSLDAALEAGIKAVEGLQAAFETMNAAIANEASRDSAIQGIKDLNATLADNGDAIRGTTDEAMSNRAAIRDAAQQWIDYAAAAKDPEQAQRRLAKGQEEIRSALKKAGIKPADSDIFKVFKAQQTESQKTVDEFAAQRDIAARYGNEVGMNFIDGIIAELQRRKDEVETAAADVTSGLTTGGNAGIDATSPSRDAMQVAGNFVDGITIGVRSGAPRVKGEATKLAKGLAKAFTDSLNEASGSIAGAINAVFGSIPTKSPLESVLGDEAAEKFVKNNTKALQALVALGDAFDVIAEKVSFAVSAITALSEATARPFGRPSDLMEIFGSGSDIDGVIDGYLNLAQTITDSYSVLTDASIVGEKAAASNRRALQSILKQLENLTRRSIALREEYEANLEALAKAEEDYARDVEEINARYDQLDREAAANIKAIEDRWAGVIPGLESAAANARAVYERENTALQALISERDGFLKQIADGARSFLNNLSFTKRKAEVAAKQAVPEKQIIETVQTLANGIRVITKREVTPAVEEIAEAVEEPLAAVDIRSSLEARLADLRAFSQNIRTLVARGLDPALVKQFVSAGVSGAGEAAAALAAGSVDEISAINSVQNALASEVAQFGQYAADEWHNAAIAQQEAVVGAALTQQQIAERALAQATAMRDRELKAAQDFAQTLKDQRQADLVQREAEYEAEKARLEARNRELQEQMDMIAQLIQNWISRIAGRLPQQTQDAGQDAARKLLAGFRKAYPDVFDKLNKLMDELARSMNRVVTMTVRTVYEATGSLPKRAMGGPVQARTAYLVGERGPEVFVPYGNGNIIPNTALGSVPSMGARAASGGTAVININVNAGMGADGAEIGRHIVDSLRQYERRNGPIPVSVTG